MLFEKIKHYKQYLGPEFAPYVDKIIVKDLVCEHILVAPIVRILDGPDDISEADISGNVFLKASHGSGWNIDLADITDLEQIRRNLHIWNTVYKGNNEPHYGYLKPRFFLEEKWEDAILGKTEQIIVYMFRCIDGEPISIGVKKGNKQNSYDMSWKPVMKEEFLFSKPPVLDEMLCIAKKLSAPFEFVRIDLYWTTKGIAFSEYTFTPAGGNPFFPMPLEMKLGLLWKP